MFVAITLLFDCLTVFDFWVGVVVLCLVDLLFVRLFDFVCDLLLMLPCCGWFASACLLVFGSDSVICYVGGLFGLYSVVCCLICCLLAVVALVGFVTEFVCLGLCVAMSLCFWVHRVWCLMCLRFGG